MADGMAELFIRLHQRNRAVVLGLENLGEARVQHRQVLFERVDGARLVGGEILAQVLDGRKRDVLDRQLALDAVLELVHHEVELCVAVQHGCLLIEKFKHFFLKRRALFAELVCHREQLALDDGGSLFEIDEAERFGEARHEEAERAARALFFIRFEHVEDGCPRLIRFNARPQLRGDARKRCMVAAAFLQPVPDARKERFWLDVLKCLAHLRSDGPCLRFGVLPQQEVAHVMKHLMRQTLLRLRRFEPRQQHRQQVEPFEMAENLAARKEFLLHHRHGRLDERRTAARQDGRMIRKAQRFPKECRDGEPVSDAADERSLSAEQKAFGNAVAGAVKMRRKRHQERRKSRKQRLVGLVPVFPEKRHQPHPLSASVTRM